MLSVTYEGEYPMITAQAPGAVTLTATAPNGVSGLATVIVE